jgi:hypothetical protein
MGVVHRAWSRLQLSPGADPCRDFLLAAWHLNSKDLREYLPTLVLLGAVEAVRYAFDLWKFRREAAYHLWSSKLWGICLFVGFFSLLVFGRGGLFVGVPIYVGILVDLEGLAVSFVLREWESDVPTVVYAWRLRQAHGAPVD